MAMELGQIPGDTHTLVQFAVSPDGSTLVATGQLTGLLLIFDLANPDQPRLREQIPVGLQPWHPIYHPTENVVYFGAKMDNKVVAVNTDTGEVLWETSHPGLDHPHGSVISPDGTLLFISSNGPGGMQMGGMEMGGMDHEEMDHEAMGHEGMDHGQSYDTGTVTVLDTRDGSVVKVLEMGNNTTGVGARAR